MWEFGTLSLCKHCRLLAWAPLKEEWDPSLFRKQWVFSCCYIFHSFFTFKWQIWSCFCAWGLCVLTTFLIIFTLFFWPVKDLKTNHSIDATLLHGISARVVRLQLCFVCVQDSGIHLGVVDDSNEHMLTVWDWQKKSKIAEIKVWWRNNNSAFTVCSHPLFPPVLLFRSFVCCFLFIPLYSHSFLIVLYDISVASFLTSSITAIRLFFSLILCPHPIMSVIHFLDVMFSLM